MDKVTVFDQALQMLNVEFRDGQCCRCLVNNLFLGGFELLLGCIFEIVNVLSFQIGTLSPIYRRSALRASKRRNCSR